MAAILGFVEFRMKGSIDRSSRQSQIIRLAWTWLQLPIPPHLATGDCKSFNQSVDKRRKPAYL
jgi:hypothetical protein